MNVASIPTDELLDDLAEAQADARLCEAAQQIGIEVYHTRNGEERVSHRLEVNWMVEKKIREELEKRQG